MKIAVIGVQGDVMEHIEALKRVFNRLKIDGEIIWARNKNELQKVDGIIIPGGESTTIGKLMSISGMDKVVIELAKQGTQILGTCAGAILLSNIKLINIKVDRNAYGRQKDSFEAQVTTPLGKMDGVFIRAPLIKEIQKEARVFAKHKKEIVGAEQDNILALTFHPELSGDAKIFQYFLRKIIDSKK
ncbi:pyridoxal 5'-phosphate synthase glutaminase subunit PdxT [Candidatus Pacearchaeota archaeon]|nr:MAG: pyridoxal 5'-phosphate synthase glutaminase subunit PdxT [Candidatus Pacearchaeota archaeon]